jgi:hypothetical protein
MVTDIYVLIQQSHILQERELEEAAQRRYGGPDEAEPPIWQQLAAPLQQVLLRRRGLGDGVGIAECLILLAGVTAGRIKTAGAQQVPWTVQSEGGRGAQSPNPNAGARCSAQQVARLLGAAEILLETTSTDLDRRARRVYEQTSAISKQLLGEQGFETARRTGRTMTLDEAIADALEGLATQTSIYRDSDNELH